jgi:hypothetical protein
MKLSMTRAEARDRQFQMRRMAIFHKKGELVAKVCGRKIPYKLEIQKDRSLFFVFRYKHRKQETMPITIELFMLDEPKWKRILDDYGQIMKGQTWGIHYNIHYEPDNTGKPLLPGYVCQWEDGRNG